MGKKFKVIRKVFFNYDEDMDETESILTDEKEAREKLIDNYYSDCRMYNFDEFIPGYKKIKDSYEVGDFDDEIRLEGYIEIIED